MFDILNTGDKMIKRTNYIEQIKPFIGSEFIKVITGVRRSGKSVLLRQLQRLIDSQNIIAVNFDNLENPELLDFQALHDYILQQTATASDEKWYLFFDEIQLVYGWEKAVNSLQLHDNFDIYVTGSNAKLLSGEFATYIAGRYVSFQIYPFSYREFLSLNANRSFEDYLTMGGMPSSLSFDGKSQQTILNDIYSSIILKDIVNRHAVRDVDLLERLITFVLANVGRQISATSIRSFLKSQNRKLSTETILNYLSYCKEACLFESVSYRDIEGKEFLRTNEKYYVCDLGFREITAHRNLADIELCLENIVYFELRRRGYNVRVGKFGNKEIDFIAENTAGIHYFQVSYQLGSAETREREFNNLAEIKDNYPKTVLSMDTIDFSQKGIEHQNIEKWLLDK